MNQAIKYSIITFFAIFVLYILLWPTKHKPTKQTVEYETELPKKKVTHQNNFIDQTLETPIDNQTIQNQNIQESIVNLKAGYAKVKIQFAKEFKDESNLDTIFEIIIYKDHQEIYRAEKKENEYLDMQFKIKETYQFYLFFYDTMAYHNFTISETDTTIESFPKEKFKKIMVKNDFKNLFAEFNLGSFTYDKKYKFNSLTKNESSFNEFRVFPGIKFPKGNHLCKLMLSNTNGAFTFEKTFEEIYNDEPIDTELPTLKEINIKILNNETAINFDLSFIPEKFIFPSADNNIEKIPLTKIGAEAYFFTNENLCKIILASEDIQLSKIVSLKEALTFIEFDLGKSNIGKRKIIVKNNPFEDKLKLFQYIDKQVGPRYIGTNYGIIINLKPISKDVFEYPINTSDEKEVLFFDIIETTTAENENNNIATIEHSRIGYLGIDFFKGSPDESIEIDFGKLQFFNVTLKSNNLDFEPYFLISLNEHFVFSLNKYVKKEEILLLLKKGNYRVFYGDESEKILFSQNLEVYADATFTLLNEYNNIISPDEKASEDKEEKTEAFYLSFKKDLPDRLSLFQILKNLNCAIEIKPNHNYAKLDNSYILMGRDGDNEIEDDFEIIVSKLVENQFKTMALKNFPISKYTRPEIDSKFLQGSEIIFLKSFAPISSDIRIFNLIQNFLINYNTFKRNENDNFLVHLFLNNFEFITLPPLNKPNDKVKMGFYGIVNFRFSNPHHHLMAFEILDENEQIQNSNHSDFFFLDSHIIYTDNTTNGNCFKFNFLEFGNHKLQVSNLTTGITFTFPFQVTDKYQEIEVK